MFNKKIIAQYSLINAVIIYIIFIIMTKGGLHLNPLIIDFVKLYTLIILIILIAPSFIICCISIIKRQWKSSILLIILTMLFIIITGYFMTN